MTSQSRNEERVTSLGNGRLIWCLAMSRQRAPFQWRSFLFNIFAHFIFYSTGASHWIHSNIQEPYVNDISLQPGTNGNVFATAFEDGIFSLFDTRKSETGEWSKDNSTNYYWKAIEFTNWFISSCYCLKDFILVVGEGRIRPFEVDYVFSCWSHDHLCSGWKKRWGLTLRHSTPNKVGIIYYKWPTPFNKCQVIYYLKICYSCVDSFQNDPSLIRFKIRRSIQWIRNSFGLLRIPSHRLQSVN